MQVLGRTSSEDEEDEAPLTETEDLTEGMTPAEAAAAAKRLWDNFKRKHPQVSQ